MPARSAGVPSPPCETGRKRDYFSPMGRKKKRPAARLDPVRKRLLRLLTAKGSNLRTASVS